ncbi:MAG: hypothetical protein FJX73_12040 [Armatimonadetes bacterium]|nr:hypothetical protein [Armatimonadota bacterium]
MPATRQRKPISGRVSEENERQLRALARQERRTVSQVLARLVEEGLRMRRHPGITFVDGPQGRRAHLAGTGFDVWEVVALHRAYEGDVARLLGDHSGLDRREIEIAVAYGEAHRDEIDGFLTENDQAG